jgi:anti-sigma B factor antagonist
MADQKKGRLVSQTVGEVTAVFFQDARILDETTVKAIAEELMQIADQSYKLKLLLDFSNVEYLSSAVLGKLVALHKKITEGKGQLKLCAIKPAIREVFKITKLDKLFELHDTNAAAMNAFATKRFGAV